jgi:MFS transporter, DHA2 family, multidrug resistance protein
MSYLAGNLPQNLEQWEQEEQQFLNSVLAHMSYRRRMAILLTAGVVTAVELANRISVNVILPDMQGNVGASSDEISWVIILYNVGFLCSLALAAWMSRVIGARRHLLISIGFYSVGAMGCVLSAHSLRLLLVSRLIMGFGGGAFLVRTIILSRLLFPGNERIAAVTWLYTILYVFEIPYPTAMGWITDQLHWNFAFLIDFPFLLIGAFLIWNIIPPGFLTGRKKDVHVDVWGAFLLIASLACLQTALSRGEQDLWLESGWIVSALLAAAIFLVAFLWWELRPENKSPVFHLRTIWRQVSLRTSFSVVMILGAFLGAGLYVVPQYLRLVQGYSATQTGGFISMYTTGLGTGLVLALRVLNPRLGGPRTMAIGLISLFATYGAIVYVWTPTTPTYILAPITFLQGFALAPVIFGAAVVATGSALLPDVNDVSTTFFFVRQLGNTLGVTAATVLVDHRMTLHSARLLDVANRLDLTTRSTLAQYADLIYRNGGASSNPALGAIQIFEANVITQSRLLSYIDICFGLAVLALLALVFLAVAQIKPKHGTHHFFPW